MRKFLFGMLAAGALFTTACMNEGLNTDQNDVQVSLTGTIKVPLKRNTLTLLKGKYMNQESSDWLHIDPDYDGDFNLYI